MNYAWTQTNDGNWVYSGDLCVLGGTTKLVNGGYMYWVNVANKFEISLGAKTKVETAKQALVRFMSI